MQLLLAGVAQGCVYALVALGFVQIYKATETVNFAQGDLMIEIGVRARKENGAREAPFFLR